MASVYKRGGKKNRNGKWYISWFDHNGKRRAKCSGTTDKATAERIVKKLEADAALRRDGVVDATLEGISKESQRTIELHLADYEAKLSTAKRHPRYIRDSKTIIRAIASFCDFVSAADITADGVNRYAQSLRDESKSSATIHFHLTIIKAFTKWLTANHKLVRDPLVSIRKPNASADRQRERRMLLPDEWKWLRYATENGPERFGITGAERSLLYATAIQTGLRSKELRSLTRGCLFLSANEPYITLKARSAKNRKDARQYVQADLAADLSNHVANKAPKARVFKMPHETDVAQMLRADLAEARTLWLESAKKNHKERQRREESDFLLDTNHEGQVFDFHSLRHTCGAWLAMTGAHPKAVQTVMRHSAITLTMDTYGHMFPGQEAETVARFPEMMTATLEALQATGTDDESASSTNEALRQMQQSCSESERTVASQDESKTAGGAEDESPKSLRIAELGEAVRSDATGCENRAGGTRTPNQQIMSLLL